MGVVVMVYVRNGDVFIGDLNEINIRNIKLVRFDDWVNKGLKKRNGDLYFSL